MQRHTMFLFKVDPDSFREWKVREQKRLEELQREEWLRRTRGTTLPGETSQGVVSSVEVKRDVASPFDGRFI